MKMVIDRTQASAAVQRILDEAVENGEELGCQVVVYQDGEIVVDVSSGYTDQERTRNVDPDTLFPIFSCGKSIAATAVHRLVEQGKIAYDTKLADVWPEYGCNGKESTTLEHVLRHQSGIYVYPKWNTFADIADWEDNCGQVAAMKPGFEPGSRTVYQSLTFTWLVCETAQRVDGRDFSTILEDEIYKPAGIDSIFFGIPEKDFERCSPPVNGADMPAPNPDLVYSPLARCVVQKDVREACLPGFNCITNARSMARYYAALIGALPGVPSLVSEETLSRASTWKPGRDENKETPEGHAFGLGYILFGPDVGNLGSIIGHTGCGGAVGLAIPEKRLAFAYTKNLLHHEKQETLTKVYAALGIQKR